MANDANKCQMIYNQGTDANPSTIGKQWNTFMMDRKAIIDAAEEQLHGRRAM